MSGDGDDTEHGVKNVLILSLAIEEMGVLQSFVGIIVMGEDFWTHAFSRWSM